MLGEIVETVKSAVEVETHVTIVVADRTESLSLRLPNWGWSSSRFGVPSLACTSELKTIGLGRKNGTPLKVAGEHGAGPGAGERLRLREGRGWCLRSKQTELQRTEGLIDGARETGCRGTELRGRTARDDDRNVGHESYYKGVRFGWAWGARGPR